MWNSEIVIHQKHQSVIEKMHRWFFTAWDLRHWTATPTVVRNILQKCPSGRTCPTCFFMRSRKRFQFDHIIPWKTLTNDAEFIYMTWWFQGIYVGKPTAHRTGGAVKLFQGSATSLEGNLWKPTNNKPTIQGWSIPPIYGSIGDSLLSLPHDCFFYNDIFVIAVLLPSSAHWRVLAFE